NFGISKADALVATGFGLAFGVTAAVWGSAMTVILRSEGGFISKRVVALGKSARAYFRTRCLEGRPRGHMGECHKYYIAPFLVHCNKNIAVHNNVIKSTPSASADAKLPSNLAPNGSLVLVSAGRPVWPPVCSIPWPDRSTPRSGFSRNRCAAPSAPGHPWLAPASRRIRTTRRHCAG